MSDEISSVLDQWKNQPGAIHTLKVRWLLNPGCAPIRNAEITEQNGIITDICSLSDSTAGDVLPVVLVPPLVNAHTHLEFAHLAEPVLPAQPFQAWIKSLMQARADAGAKRDQSIRLGLQESQTNGVRAIGEISTDAFPADCMGNVISTVLFREFIGLTPARIRDQLLTAEQHLSAAPRSGIFYGLSPHAPYTVHPDLLRKLLDLAEQSQAPVAMHVAETTDEIELLTQGRGRFADFLNGLGLFDPATFPGDRCILDILKELSRAPKALVVHGNYLTNGDVEFLREHPNLTTVYCPRTHAFFRHPEHPLRRLRAAGCKVVLGTDSRASSPDLNIWRELQFVARHFPEIPPGELLAMITTDAADSMGLDPKLYELREGRAFAGVLLACDDPIRTVEEFLRQTTFGERGLSGPRAFAIPPAARL